MKKSLTALKTAIITIGAIAITAVTVRVSFFGNSLNKAKSTEDLNKINNDDEVIDEIVEEDETTEETLIEEKTIEDEEMLEDEKYIVTPIDVVMAKSNVTVKSDLDGEKIGVMGKGMTLPIVSTLDNGGYKVSYNDEIVYVEGDVEETKEYTVDGELLNVYYTNEKTSLRDYNDENIVYEIDQNLSVLSYDENNDECFAYVDGLVGYIDKKSLTKLEGTFVIVDISKQTLTMYEDNEVLLETPVVTGKPSSPTTKGVFKIYNITTQRDLVGPGYRSYVDYMLKFNNNEGLHDAEYHKCTDKNSKDKSHGWRSSDEFGGMTFMTNGSHGCVNMPHDAVEEVYKKLTLDDVVIVQK